jgi:hypothetical protein
LPPFSVIRDRRLPEADTFQAVARDYLERHHRQNNREATYVEAKRNFERDVFPKWGKPRPGNDASKYSIRPLAGGLARSTNRSVSFLVGIWALPFGVTPG